MARLKERNRQIPGGLRFKNDILKFQSNHWHSFDKIVNDLWMKIRSNPHAAQKANMPNSRAGVEDLVDSYNAMICEQNGWLEYIQGGPDYVDPSPPPKWMPQQVIRELGGKLAVGAKSLLQWLGDGAEPVTPLQSEGRAAVCAKCPLNRQIQLKDFFVQGASELIRRQIEFASKCGLTTPFDDQLGICSACGCPLKLMVHVPIQYKLANMTQESFESLDPNCWVRAEKSVTAVTQQEVK